MKIDDNLFKAFLDEMHALENYRMTYAEIHKSLSLDFEDPDVRRVVEALAFFNARTRQAALKNISAWRLRVFQQFFPHLLSPMPAAGIMQAKTLGQFTEPVQMPKGTELSVSAGKAGMGIFRTLSDLNIFPISLLETEMMLLPNKGFRFLMHFTASHERNDETGELSFYINNLNHYLNSLYVAYALEKHLNRVLVVFDEKVTESSNGTLCDIYFGAKNADDSHMDRANPLEKERLFFHFPNQELFMNITIPEFPFSWNRFTLCFDLDSDWPKNIHLNSDIFQLFAVPIVNIKDSMAQPVTCDGTKEQYRISYPDPEYNFELHSVKGVYVVEKNGMVAMRAGILAGGEGSYEVEQCTDSKGGKVHRLNLHYSEAFEKPKTVTVEALWLQPWFSEVIGRKLEVAPYSRNIRGLEWGLLGEIVPHRENQFQDDIDVYLHIITLKNKSYLSYDDLIVLLKCMGNVQEGYLKQVLKSLKELRVEEKANNRGGMFSGLNQVYYLRFQEFDSKDLPLIENFMVHLAKVLSAWFSERTIEVRKELISIQSGAV